ncbi:hypothetical protein KL942_004415 [Ogataea angusta]|uniref:DUF788-domain-containing protein n=1 Tax=Pichia angusta TaxID=870730 RepID=A0ABQ7RUC3_PICAN|nr:hypothetical protein KL942_004415 [Ogataea angusta]KAG7847636.1 hypothetical protein KL940_003548 [Ogataea angusta]
MAGASDKKQAAANSSILRQLHLASVVVNVLALLALFLLHRPAAKKYYFIFSLPGLGCQYVLEKVGRPKYHTNPQGYSVLSSAGQDLQQQGLTEYMIDIVYLTLIIDVLMILFGSNKVWLLLLAVPAYAGYKLKGFIAPFFARKQKEEQIETEPVKSKRQQKLENRKTKSVWHSGSLRGGKRPAVARSGSFGGSECFCQCVTICLRLKQTTKDVFDCPCSTDPAAEWRMGPKNRPFTCF